MPGKPGMTGEGLGGFRPGAGRPPSKVSVKAADSFYTFQTTPEGKQWGPGEVWRVVSVSRTEIVLVSEQTGNTIKFVR